MLSNNTILAFVFTNYDDGQYNYFRPSPAVAVKRKKIVLAHPPSPTCPLRRLGGSSLRSAVSMQLEKSVTVWEWLRCEEQATAKPHGFGAPNGDRNNQTEPGQKDPPRHDERTASERTGGADDLLGLPASAQSARVAPHENPRKKTLPTAWIRLSEAKNLRGGGGDKWGKEGGRELFSSSWLRQRVTGGNSQRCFAPLNMTGFLQSESLPILRCAVM